MGDSPPSDDPASHPRNARGRWLGWLVVAALATAVTLSFVLEEAPVAPERKAPAARPTPVAATPILRGPLVERARYPGELDADAADIAAFFPGRLLSVEVRVGDRVERDAVLARLDPVDLDEQLAQAKAQVAAAQADERRVGVELAMARKELERMSPLAQQKLIAALELDLQRAKVDALRAQVGSSTARAAEAKARVALLEKRVSEMIVRAPFAGRVAERYVDPGAIVGAATRLVRLVEESPLRLRFEVPEHELVAVTPGSEVLVTTRGHRVTDPALAVTAKVTGLAGEVSRERRVATAEALVSEPPEGWLPGMYAEAHVATRALDDALIAPSVAIVSRLMPSGLVETGVFIAEGEAARWVRVDVLARSADRVAIAATPPREPRDPEAPSSAARLSAGALVLTAGHLDLTDGGAIKVAEPPRAELR